MKNGRKQTILIVDDVPENIDVLGGILKEDYRIKFAPDGTRALKIVEGSAPPDLVLLDIMMPGMDGFETCVKLKTMEKMKDVPVVFISSLRDLENKIRAFESGGVDYVDKPFWPEEVRARVATHLQLREQKKELGERMERLRELEGLRDDLVHMVVHDMRSPIGVMKGYLEMLADEAEDFFEPRLAEYLEEVKSCAARLEEMAESLLDVSRLESGRMPLVKSPCDLNGIVSKVASNPGFPFARREVRFEPASEPAIVQCDPELIRRVVANLVGNALKFTPESGTVEVKVASDQGFVRVAVEDTGEGIPEEFLDRIFQKFVSRDSARRRKKYCSTGLGLAFCKLAVEAHGGTIDVESRWGEGSRFGFSLPLAPEEDRDAAGGKPGKPDGSP